MLALVTDGFGARGGIAQYNRDFLSAAAFNGNEVVVLPRRSGTTASPLPAGLVERPPVPSRARYTLAALREARGRRPGIVFCGHLYHAPLAARIARPAGARLIVQVHGIEVWSDVPARCLRALDAADLVLAVSRDTRRRVLTLSSIAPERVAVINNTVRAEFSPGDRQAARRRFDLGDGARAILTVARLDASEGYKGQDRIIEYLPELRQQGIAATYLIAGDGTDRARLERMAQSCGVDAQVRFLGHVPDEALPDLYRAADVFALPSRGEGFGIAFLEAMACGTPAIGLAEGGAPDALGEGTLGACVSADEFPLALMRLIGGDAQAGQNLADAVQARFGQAAFAGQVARQLSRLQEIGTGHAR